MIDLKTLTLEQAASAVNGKLIGEGSFTGVYTDSRKPVPGGLFIALEGDRFDGHDFIENAEKDGAAAVLCRKECDVSIPVIYVEDTKKALLSLASYYRGLFDIPLVGLTGSVGKTTTKEMTALVLSEKYNTIKTQGNLNNDIGMPMTLFNIDETTEAAVIEMGMNHKGEISTLTAVSRPTASIITNIGVSHIENLGSRENIFLAKLEILEGMKKGSSLIINGDNDLLSTVKNDDYRIIKFGIENENCSVRAVDIEASENGTRCNILYNGQKYRCFVPVAGMHNVYDALSAFAVGACMGVEPEKAAGAIEKYVPAGMRQKVVVKNSITFVEDCYNASPDSVKAGLNTLAGFSEKRKIAVLGDMLELGDYAETAHRDCGKYAAEKNIDILFAYGKDSFFTADEAKKNGLKNVYHFTDEKELADALFNVIEENDAILFKASRGMKLENVIHIIYDRMQ